MKRVLLLAVSSLLLAIGVNSRLEAQAATKTVCAANCNYTNAQLQTAVNELNAGDTLLLEEGREYVVDLSLPVKAGAGLSAWTQIRTGVNSTGVIQPISRYVADNIRVCPSTYNVDEMNCSTEPGSQDMSRFAKIKPLSNNLYAIATADTGSGTPVSYYHFRWLEIIPNSFGGNALIGLKNSTAPTTTGTTAMIPHHFKLDQIVVRGDPLSGQFRGIQLDASYVDVTNSFFYDIKAMGEGQVILCNTTVGGLTIVNNFLSGGTETWLCGGGSTVILPQYTVQSGATTTSVTLDRVTDLYAGKNLAFRVGSKTISSTSAANPTVVTTSTEHGYTSGWQVNITGATCTGGTINASGAAGGSPSHTITVLSTTTFSIPVNCTGGAGAGGTVYVRAQTEIVSINGNALTVSPALPIAPANASLVDSSIVAGQEAPNVFRYNWMTRPSADRTGVIQAPATLPSATGSTTGGTLTAGTYTYRVVAQRATAQGTIASSAATAEFSGVVASGTTGSVAISWTAAANATQYRVYGRAAGNPTRFFTVVGATTFTDTGGAGTASGAPGSASTWQVKNTFELKQMLNATIEYNLIEHSWVAGQQGPCVVLTASQQNNGAPSAVIRNITFRKNVVRRCAQFLQIPGTDSLNTESARSGNMLFEDNLWYDAGNPYGVNNGVLISGTGGGPRQHPDRAPYDVTFSRNTFHSASNSFSRFIYLDHCDPNTTASLESAATNFVMRDNIAYAGTNSVAAVSTGTSNPNCGQGTINRRIGVAPAGPIGAGSAISHNVFAGDSNCGAYPANVTNLSCPSVATLESDTFTNTTSFAGFAVKATSPFFTGSSVGGPIGANISTFDAIITNVTMTGNNSVAGLGRRRGPVMGVGNNAIHP